MEEIKPRSKNECWPLYSCEDFIRGDHVRIFFRYYGRKSLEIREGIVVDPNFKKTDSFNSPELSLRMIILGSGRLSLNKSSYEIQSPHFYASYSYINIVKAERGENVFQRSGDEKR